MRSARRPSWRGGFTLVELILALSITALVGAAIAGMLGAVTSGVMTHRDNRSVMIRASAAQARLAAYVSPSLSILAASNEEVVLWFADTRKGGTVHVTEARWITYDSVDGSIAVNFVQFPEAWSQVSCDLADPAMPPFVDWTLVREMYTAKGYMSSRRLVDGLTLAEVWTDDPEPSLSRLLIWNLEFAAENGAVPVRVCAATHQSQTPRTP